MPKFTTPGRGGQRVFKEMKRFILLCQNLQLPAAAARGYLKRWNDMYYYAEIYNSRQSPAGGVFLCDFLYWFYKKILILQSTSWNVFIQNIAFYEVDCRIGTFLRTGAFVFTMNLVKTTFWMQPGNDIYTKLLV